MLDEKNFFILKKLLHILNKKGKKITALIIFLKLLENLKYNKLIKNKSIKEIIYQSFVNVKPLLYVKKLKKSSKVFYIPKLISTEQKISLSIRWIISSVNLRQ